MTVTTNTKSDLVSGQTAAVQAQASGYVDFSVGSILLAIVEAVADVVGWLQGLILYLLAVTRAATSQKADLDTWMADFGFVRELATGAIVQETFNRFSTSGATYVPVGATVQTPDGTQTFAVIADTSNGVYSPTAGGSGAPGYAMAVGVGSVAATMQATTAGAASNVLAGSLTVITSSIPGVDTATNAGAASGGADAESDPAFRARFVAYLASLSRATRASILYAISLVQPGLAAELIENVNYAGAAQAGNFVAIVDDGTGSPSAPLLTEVANAIDAYRPIGSTFQVHAPVIVLANIAFALTAATGYDKPSLEGVITTALDTFVNSTEFEGSLTYTRLLQLIYNASPGVANVTGLTLNGGTSDLTSTDLQVIRIGTLVIS